MPTRWKLTIEYDGRPFMGWQRQAHGASVQEEIERAIEAFSGEAPRLHVAGRTDAGVHALGQAAHFDLEKPTTARTVREALNAHLRPHPIAVLKAEPAPPGFHARTSARRRRYRYLVLNRPARPTLDEGRVWHVPQALDDDAIRAGAAALIGRHDFTTFRAAMCQAKSPIRTLDRLDAIREGDLLRFEVEARSFLHHQVRNMIGTLILVGRGKWRPAQMAAALAAKDRAAGGPTAPPDGLYLVTVDYA
ncbi:MAG TPA: tRNA pseudouridine(38-40) synthase TruA [Alphaproteobacteria bacterium]|nr:tRNA pseudouridine(38-40) synthase TruA [Alphaproteobacteria bacterium]